MIDAYDELLSAKDEKRKKAIVERKMLRSYLSLLGTTDGAKILITTRPEHLKDLQSTFPTAVVASIHGDEKDMETYLRSRLEPLGFKQAMEIEIIDKLLKANKMDKW